MPPSAASILRASSLALLLLAATATAGDGGTTTSSSSNSSVAATATVGDGGTTTASGGNSSVARPNDEMYLCYLCTGRNPMLIRYCPIYWDKCHLECEEPDVAAGPAASLRPPPAAATAPHDTHDGQACYVMKLYRNGSYVIVSWHDCDGMGSCRLSCGGGEAADGKALGAAPRPVTATAPQGMVPPPYRVAEFQRCGDQAMGLPPTAVPGRV